MARSVYLLESFTIQKAAEPEPVSPVVGVYATLRKAQQTAERLSWPLPPGQAMTWKPGKGGEDDEIYHATIKAKTETRYTITRHHVH